MADDWVEMSLGDLVDIKHGFAFKGEFFRNEPRGDVLLTPGNFAVGGGFKASSLKYYDGPVPDEFVLSEGDLLVTMTDLSRNVDTLGYPALVPPGDTGHRYLHNQRLGKVVVKADSKVDLRYLHYLLCSPEYRTEIVAGATGTTVKHTSPGRIKRFRFRVPPLGEQRAIAHILGTLDDKIELNRRTSETLEAMARALFKSWFVHFDPVRAKAEGRDPGLSRPFADLFPARFVPSQLGGIPEGWAVATLGEVADVIDCLHSKKPERSDSGLPLLQLSNIRDDGLIDLEDRYLIDESDYQRWTSRIEISSGDCVLTNVGRVGAAAQAPDGVRAALGRNMTGVRPKPGFPFPTVLIECLLSQAMREEIALKVDSGTILDALNVRSIPKLRFVRAGNDVLRRFEQCVRPMRSQMEQRLAESRTLIAIRDALLPRLVSGEQRIQAVRDLAEVTL